jgi:hypothetical protein
MRKQYSIEIRDFSFLMDPRGVNDTVGHTTCLVYALKSHILQTRLTGHTTCKTCAPEVTNRSVVCLFFFVKTHYTLDT